ncbi:hypothetical protein BRC81_00215 [Halobacteriales archaeon QS_1_68_20]|nr:MAG: hypothetical protein BRC81_00215 [Halobacteriales archaeon QS_1_68_20]
MFMSEGREHDDIEDKGDAWVEVRAGASESSIEDTTDDNDNVGNDDDPLSFPEAESDDSQSTTDGDCPDCGGGMDDAPAGRRIQGEHEYRGDVVVETENGDKWCDDCEILKTGDGEVVR